MIRRFEGDDGRRRLREALQDQEAVAGDKVVAARLADVTNLKQFEPGVAILTQDGPDNDICFILAGNVSVQVNGREIACRTAGQHVGEMALIDVSAPRSATVVAIDQVVIGRVGEADFVKVASISPNLWRNLAKQLCVRLRQRNALVRQRNDKPLLFIGCSRETLEIAQVIQLGLKDDPIVVRVWTDGVFGASSFPLEDLEREINRADFATLVGGPDDRTTSRGWTSDAPRDNVVFEIGLFMGALGHARTFLIKPNGVDLKIPSDLLGLTHLEFHHSSDLVTALAPICTELRQLIRREGPR